MHFNDPLLNPPKTDWVRLWDCGVTWKDIHIGPNQYDLSRLDYLVNLYSDRNILYTIAATPQWLAKNPNNPHYAQWLGLGSNSIPFDLGHWEKFISIIVKRYNGKIQAYEIWNEPQLADFLYPYTLKNVNALAEMTKRAYNIIKSENKNTLVLSAPVLPRRSSGGMKRAGKYLHAIKRKGWPVDRITCHIYPEVGHGPEKFAYYLADTVSYIKRMGGPSRVWITEANYNLLGPIIDDKQAWNYVRDTYKYAGKYPLFWYSWNKTDALGGLNINEKTTSWAAINEYG